MAQNSQDWNNSKECADEGTTKFSVEHCACLGLFRVVDYLWALIAGVLNIFITV
jgi:hypothetical protein